MATFHACWVGREGQGSAGGPLSTWISHRKLWARFFSKSGNSAGEGTTGSQVANAVLWIHQLAARASPGSFGFFQKGWTLPPYLRPTEPGSDFKMPGPLCTHSRLRDTAYRPSSDLLTWHLSSWCWERHQPHKKQPARVRRTWNLGSKSYNLSVSQFPPVWDIKGYSMGLLEKAKSLDVHKRVLQSIKCYRNTSY